MDGVDYAWTHPGGSALQAAGKQFVCRYSSTDATKDLTLAEAKDLAAHGVSSVIVRESTANRAGQGQAAGVADAHAAVATAQGCQMPDGRPLYFAVDYDADPATVVPYFKGVASTIGIARTGVYGSYRVVKYLLDHGYVTWGWQTAAWSKGQWDPRAHIRQYAKTTTINGVSCDINTSMQPDFGQWTPGNTPNVEDIVTPADIDAVATAVLKKLTAAGAPLADIDNPTTSDNKTETWRAMAWDTGKNAGQANANTTKILDQLQKGVPLALTDDQVSALATKLAANPTFAGALAHAIGADFAARLQS